MPTRPRPLPSRRGYPTRAPRRSASASRRWRTPGPGIIGVPVGSALVGKNRCSKGGSALSDVTTRSPKHPPKWFVHTAWRVHRVLYRLSGGRFLWTTSNNAAGERCASRPSGGGPGKSAASSSATSRTVQPRHAGDERLRRGRSIVVAQPQGGPERGRSLGWPTAAPGARTLFRRAGTRSAVAALGRSIQTSRSMPADGRPRRR